MANSGEYEHHVVGTRLRVNGSGNLKLTFEDLDAVQSVPLIPLVMEATTRFEPFCLANIQSQRIRLVGETTEINEQMSIGRIVIFAKPVAKEYPGR